MSWAKSLAMAEKIHGEMSPSDKAVLPVHLIAYGMQKLAPEIFFYNVYREYLAKRSDGANAMAAASKRLAVKLSQMAQAGELS